MAETDAREKPAAGPDGEAQVPDGTAWREYRRKPRRVYARRVTKTQTVDTPRGVLTARAGDWITVDSNGHELVWDEEQFRLTHQESAD